jgi:hypothetical protein
MKTIIVAPHPDDEIIGCFSVLNSNLQSKDPASLQVWYVEKETAGGKPDLYAIRHAEATYAAVQLKFVPRFVSLDTLVDRLTSLAEEEGHVTLYIPSSRDSHPFHKKVNRKLNELLVCATNVEGRFYSVDLGQGSPSKRELPNFDVKRDWLNKFYPSQRDLWDNDASYYLFEDIVSEDFTATRTVRALINGKVILLTASLPAGITLPVMDGPLQLVHKLHSLGVNKFHFTFAEVTYENR